MNLIQMLIFMLLSALLLGLGWLLSLKWGTFGFLVTAVPVAMVWVVVLFFTYRALIQESKWIWTSRPYCRNNKCGAKQYVLVSATPKQAVFRCKCGDLYLSKAGHFSQILHGGALLPYMMRDTLGEWKADRGLSAPDDY